MANIPLNAPQKDGDGRAAKETEDTSPPPLEKQVETLQAQIIGLEEQLRARDIELRSALLSIVADIERRNNLEPRREKRWSGGYTSPYVRE